MNFKHFLWVAAFALAFTACDNDDDINESESSVGKILFSTTVTNPSGDSGSGYLQAVASLEGGTHYSNANAIPSGVTIYTFYWPEDENINVEVTAVFQAGSCYYLRIGGTWVTSENAEDILDDLYDDTIPITEFVSKTNLYGESQIVCEAKGGGGKGGGGKGPQGTIHGTRHLPHS